MNPKDGYISYIINPKSGSNSRKIVSREFKNYLVSKGFDVRCSVTKSLEHARQLANEAAVDFDCAMVAAVGGDGTIREIAHGLEGSDKPLFMVPSGTENLLAHEMGFDGGVKPLIEVFEKEYKRPLDLGCINGQCFACIAGFGFDADVVKRVAAKREGHINHFAYFWPIWRTFWHYKFPVLKVEIDGETVFEDRGLVFVGNISHYAIGLEIAKNADFSDGLLDVCIFKCANRFSLIKISLLTMFKQHLRSKQTTYLRGKNIKVSSPAANMCSEIDGDPGPDLPAEIEIIPSAVNVMAIEGGKPVGLRTRILRAIG
ncbi:MAG: diacylglycerol kinase family protein [Phycisphaerae bacterium]|nr:diacylglycerol kinase family protein [Phycisphaerae bacterium]